MNLCFQFFIYHLFSCFEYLLETWNYSSPVEQSCFHWPELYFYPEQFPKNNFPDMGRAVYPLPLLNIKTFRWSWLFMVYWVDVPRVQFPSSSSQNYILRKTIHWENYRPWREKGQSLLNANYNFHLIWIRRVLIRILSYHWKSQ